MTVVPAVLQIDGWCVVLQGMDPHEMLWAEAALGLAPLCGALKPGALKPCWCWSSNIRFILNLVLGSLARLVPG